MRPDGGSETTANRGSFEPARSAIARVSSREPSSTTTQCQAVKDCRVMLAREAASVEAASRAGNRIETRALFPSP